jgi:DNA replication protein DnaC
MRFFQTADLLGSFTRDLDSCDLLTVNEPGVLPLHCHAAEGRFQVIASCYERRSVAITTNLELGQWNTVISHNRLPAALIDRLVHHGHVPTVTGESHRLRNALSQPNASREADGMGSQQEAT